MLHNIALTTIHFDDQILDLYVILGVVTSIPIRDSVRAVQIGNVLNLNENDFLLHVILVQFKFDVFI